MTRIQTVDAKSADVRFRLEPELKEAVNEVLADVGLNLSDAIRLFLRQVVVYRGLPFEVRQPNAATTRAVKEARSLSNPRYGSVKELMNDLEARPRRKGRRTPAAK